MGTPSRQAFADLARFLVEIAGVIERHGGTVTREYETIALLGRRA